jgi:hypothetical protein
MYSLVAMVDSMMCSPRVVHRYRRHRVGHR